MDDFTRAAVIGIGGMATLPPVEGSVETLLANGNAARERQFLLRAGARAIYRAAGTEIAATAQPNAATPEVLPPCSDVAASIFHEALLDGDEELCTELARLVAERQQRAAFELLPLLLSVRSSPARAAVRLIAGNRGAWLAALRDDWRWLLPAGASTDGLNAVSSSRARWDEGSLADRRALLGSVRATQPDIAREWLTSVWKEESAENRATFLELFATSVTPADEEFLEKARADRSVGVRAVAVRLLARIPSSSFLQSCIARATESLRFESKASVGFGALVKAIAGKERRTLKLICEPPPADDPLTKDFGTTKSGGAGGVRAQLLARLLSLIDPRLWEARAAATPAEIANAAGETDWFAPLAEGFARAALLHRSAAWHLPLLRAAATSDELLRQEWVNDIARALTRDDAEQLVLDVLEGRAPRLLGRAELFLSAVPAPWTAPFSSKVLSAVRGILARGGDGDEMLTWTSALPRIARAIDPSTFPDAVREWTLGETYYAPSRARQLEHLQRIVELRNRFHEEMKRD